MLSKLCRKFGFEEIKAAMPEEDRKLIANMKTIAEREIRAKKARLGGAGEGAKDRASAGDQALGAEKDDTSGIARALRKFDAMMEGERHVS